MRETRRGVREMVTQTRRVRKWTDCTDTQTGE